MWQQFHYRIALQACTRRTTCSRVMYIQLYGLLVIIITLNTLTWHLSTPGSLKWISSHPYSWIRFVRCVFRISFSCRLNKKFEKERRGSGGGMKWWETKWQTSDWNGRTLWVFVLSLICLTDVTLGRCIAEEPRKGQCVERVRLFRVSGSIPETARSLSLWAPLERHVTSS